ncbi:unnamed protein product [Cuscuta campestris]|uniref:Topo IIA-type catalytic domain-containing protein n=1 Tax=Cuscuta campestris TaxID=132261 RepID=A0A484MDA4_9ASTE|nr:unnamed protein product [Cuscuta campestris]
MIQMTMLCISVFYFRSSCWNTIQKDNVSNQRELIVHLLTNEQSKFRIPKEPEPALTETMLLSDIDQNAVNFVPNFDNSQKEPSLLPARIPNLLLNGASGIAVGMATNIPPHNLGELVDAMSSLIHNPEVTVVQRILEAYRTGRGQIVVRGKTDVELLDSKTKRTAIIIRRYLTGQTKHPSFRRLQNLWKIRCSNLKTRKKWTRRAGRSRVSNVVTAATIGFCRDEDSCGLILDAVLERG